MSIYQEPFVDNQAIQLEMQRFAVLWTQAHPVVAAFISGIVPRHHDAEDILQRTAASLVALRDKYDPDQPFVAWALGVARIEVLRHRQECRRQKLVFDTEAVEALASAFERAAPDMSDRRAALDGCIAKLRGRIREIFELRYVQGLGCAQIAERLHRTQQAIFLSLHRGRNALRDCMQRSLDRQGGAL